MKSITVKNVTIGEGITKICVPLVAPTEFDIKRQIKDIAKSEADMVEFRADLFEECLDETELNKAMKLVREGLPDMPILFTFRSKSEGGDVETTVEEYKKLIMDAIESGYCDLVDVEFFKGNDLVSEIIEAAHAKGIYVIVSNHDFKTTIPMEQIVTRFKGIIDTGADIAKIAMMPEVDSQVVDMMQAAKELQECGNETPLIVISMGRLGVTSRTTGEMYGNAVTFGSVGNSSAPGQVEVTALKSQLEMIHKIIHSMR